MNRLRPDQMHVVAILVVLFLSAPVASFGDITLSANDQYRYAEALFADHHYQQAADEYRRFIHFFPDDPLVMEAEYRIGLARYRGHEFRLAVKSFSRIVNQTDFSGPYFSSYYMIGRSYLALEQIGSAVTTLNNLMTVTDDPNEKDAAGYALGWLQLEYLWPEETGGRFDSFQAARKSFDKISSANRETYQLGALQTELDRADDIPRKNPWMAGALSIVPGGGQLYCERYQDAFTALIVNAAFGVATYESFDNELYALGSLIAMVGTGFYAGNIWGAVTDAHKYNREQRRRFMNDLKKRLQIRFSVEKPFSFSLHYDF